MYPYEFIKSLAKAFEENGQLVPKHRGDVRYPIVQDEHIQWLIKRLDAKLNITVKSLYHQLNEVFQFPCHVSINYFSKAIWSQVGLTSS